MAISIDVLVVMASMAKCGCEDQRLFIYTSLDYDKKAQLFMQLFKINVSAWSNF